jgi:hypothetical protein
MQRCGSANELLGRSGEALATVEGTADFHDH